MVSHLIRTLYTGLLLALSAMALATVTASVDRTQMYQDELLTLSVSVSPMGSLSRQDISALESLFTIVSSTQQRSTQIINGRSSTVAEYRFTLAPKELGTLGIPSFQVDNRSSDPIFIEVLDIKNRQDDLTDQDIRLQATLANTSVYVDQPTLLTVKLMYRIGLRSGRIASIDLDGVSADLIDETQTTEQINGVSYNVYQQQYQITANTAGEFVIPELVFSGQYQDATTRQVRSLTRTSDALTMTVKDIPAEFPANAFWLPSTDVAIADNLDQNLTLTDGEHIDWQIMLSAVAIPAEALPNPLMNISQSTEWRVYQNQPQFQTRPTYNSRTDTAAVSPITQQAGNLTLPAVRIPWWDLKSDTLAWAELPERNVTVIASTASEPIQQAPQNTATPVSDTDEVAALAIAPQEKSPPLWFWLSLSTNAVLASILSWLLLTRHRPARSGNPASLPTTKPSEQPIAEDLGTIYRQLLTIARSQKQPLNDIIDRLPPPQQREFERLQSTLFGKASASPPTLKEAQWLLSEFRKATQSEPSAVPSRYSLYPS